MRVAKFVAMLARQGIMAVVFALVVGAIWNVTDPGVRSTPGPAISTRMIFEEPRLRKWQRAYSTDWTQMLNLWLGAQCL